MAVAEEAPTPLIKQDLKSTTATSSNIPPTNPKAAFALCNSDYFENHFRILLASSRLLFRWV